ncbi:MAG TPA: substrate-binding domain-containing protein, partial [Lacipirellulaceae bacterium]|nr:substrate-binding domain-containing protein [Lacipirellulaceae bacterium]
MNALRWVLAAVAVAAVAVAIWLRQSVPDDSAHHLTPVKIALVTSGSGPYWQIAVSGAKAAARELSVDLEVGTSSGSENLQEQTEILGRLAEGGVRGVAVSPINAEGQVDAINQLADQGLKVVTFDSDAPESKRQGYVGTSNFAAGRGCGRLAAEALPGGGKIAVLAANRTKDNLIDRMGGLQEVLARLEGARTSGAAAEGDDAENDKQAAEPLEIVDFYIDDG